MPMPLELLQALADAELPIEIVNPSVRQSVSPSVHRELRILHEAGHIICSFPPLGTARPQPACVHMVTPPQGAAVLRTGGLMATE